VRREVKVPKWGLTIHEVTIVEWLKALGDEVAEGEGLVEVETDKADAPIESPAGGTVVEILAQPGDVCPVGQTIAVLDAPG
jgi:pyruvate/2-oxoglutarate dehydrogenase complex dihydrolipoamide acyltransferase (E2) component